MFYAIIKNWNIICFSDVIPVKTFEWEFQEKENKKWVLETVCIKQPIEGMEYDQVIEIVWDYDYKKEYFFNWIEITEKTKDEYLPKIKTKSEIQEELWKLVAQRNGMIELLEDTTYIDMQIQALKDEYVKL